MSVAEQTRLKFELIKPKIGARILNDKAELLSGALAAELRDLLERRGVLVFPQVNFTDDEQIAFTKTLGKFATELHGQNIYKISLDKSLTPTAEYLKGAFFWHVDGVFSPMPIRASILSAKVLSPWGGNTDYCNTYAAYDDLSDEDKKRFADLKVVHAPATSQLYVSPEPSYEQFLAWKKIGVGPKTLPLVWTHQSGRKSLLIGNTADHVVGMDPLESKELLIRLRDWATQPQFSYSHEWTVGDAVMWDNTGTLHRATEYPLDCGRLLHRTKLEGEEPVV